MNQNHLKITISHWQNNLNWRNSSRKRLHSTISVTYGLSISKKDEKLRPCQDYRYLNDWTIKNSYPLPLISDILDKLKGAKYFTKLDVQWGYNNICICKGDEWKAAFKTNKGLFEPTVMFFGMCNSPATFQAMIDDIFVGMIDGKLIIIYMDDILIFAKTKEELEKITKMVLAKLREHNLFLKAKKCKFCRLQIEYPLKKGKFPWTPSNLLEYEIGQPPQW